jgi:DNA invertase Pin-like site-specific DNA recombinase
MKSSNNIRVAIYARISTTGHGQDIGLQVDELNRIAKQRGWNIAGAYLDEGVSGSKASRPALNKMLGDAQAGLFDLVLVWKLDRLGRSLKHLLGLLDELTSWNIGFVSARDAGIDTTTPSGRLMIQMLGAFAEFERALIKERVTAGVRRAQAQGVHCGRPVVNLDLKPIRTLLAAGHGLKFIAKALGVSRSTLRRRLTEADEWPRTDTVPGGGQKP